MSLIRFISLYRTIWFQIVFGNNGANERLPQASALKMLALGASPGSSEEEEECLPLRQFIYSGVATWRPTYL